MENQISVIEYHKIKIKSELYDNVKEQMFLTKKLQDLISQEQLYLKKIKELEDIENQNKSEPFLENSKSEEMIISEDAIDPNTGTIKMSKSSSPNKKK